MLATIACSSHTINKVKYKCFIAMFHYLQYHSLCPWVLPKCKPFETEKVNDSNWTAKHGCALCSYCPASSLVLNAEKFAVLPGHLEQPGSVKLWSQRIVSWSVQGDAGTRICSVSSWTLLGIQGFWLHNKTPLYTTLSSSHFSFWCKYWFISNSFCCWFSLVYVSFKLSTSFEARSSLLNYLKRANTSRITTELLLDTEIGDVIS